MIRFWSQDGDNADQAAALRVRTVIVGWLALAAGLAALLAAISLVLTLDDVFGRLGSDRFPPLHVPPSLRAAGGSSWLSWLALGLMFTGVWGMSTGRLRRMHSWLAIGAALLVGGVDAATCSPLRSPAFVVPSELARHVKAGRFGEAEAILAQYPNPVDANNYVRAQVALRAGDARALAKEAGKLLDMADAWYYGLQDTNPGYWASSSMSQFRSQVIHAVDVGANAAPTAGVSLAVDRQQRRGTTSAVARLLAEAVVLAGCGLLAWGLFVVWRVMRRHSVAVTDYLG